MNLEERINNLITEYREEVMELRRQIEVITETIISYRNLEVVEYLKRTEHLLKSRRVLYRKVMKLNEVIDDLESAILLSQTK